MVSIKEICQFINEAQVLGRALKQSSSVGSVGDQGQQTKLKDVKKEPTTYSRWIIKTKINNFKAKL